MPTRAFLALSAVFIIAALFLYPFSSHAKPYRGAIELVLIVMISVFLLVRRLASQRIVCNSCFMLARRRTMTTLADGRLICKQCLHRAISDGMQHAIRNLPGAVEAGAFALEQGDARTGEPCRLCSRTLQPVDAVCFWAGGLVHHSCAQLAYRLASHG